MVMRMVGNKISTKIMRTLKKKKIKVTLKNRNTKTAMTPILNLPLTEHNNKPNNNNSQSLQDAVSGMKTTSQRHF